MYKILKAEKLADKIYLMNVHAPRVASHCQPGQFVIVKMDEKGERIPLTICDYDREAGTITIVFQEVGASTVKMGELKAGDSFRDFTGPLGCASEFVHEDLESLKNKKMLFVAGGVGAAPVYPQVKWLKAHGIDAFRRHHASVRILVDLQLYYFGATLEDAVKIYEEELGFDRVTARAQVQAHQNAPGYFTCYYYGMKKICDWEKEYGYTKWDYTELLFSAGRISMESLEMLVKMTKEEQGRFFTEFRSLLMDE